MSFGTLYGHNLEPCLDRVHDGIFRQRPSV
jgi:hypothetical protein